MTGRKYWRGKARVMVLIAATASLTACGMTPDEEAAAIEKSIMETAGADELWAAVKEQYPDDLADLVSRLQAANAALGNGTNRGENPNAEELGKEIGAEWLREFFERIGPDAVKAPAAQLIVWSASESALYTALQRSAVSECAAMTMGQWILIDPSDVAATAAISRRNAAMVRASAAGRDNPQSYAQPSEADFEQLGNSIAATGISSDLQASLGSDEAMAALTPAEQCQIGVSVYSGLSALPDDDEPAIAAYMLSPSN